MRLSVKLVFLFSVTLSAPAIFAAPKSWVELNAELNAKQYASGATIDVKLRAKNISDKRAFLHFSSGQRFDVQLFRQGQSGAAYTWSANKMFPLMVGQLRLAPGESQTFTARLDGAEQLNPGTYELRAFLANSSPIAAKPVSLVIMPAPIQTRVSLSKTQIKAGEGLTFSLTATNTTKTARQLDFRSGQRFDFALKNAAGETVWSWAANKRFIQSLSREALAPGETRTWTATWDGQPLPDQKLTPGTYLVEGVLTTRPPLAQAPIKVEIK